LSARMSRLMSARERAKDCVLRGCPLETSVRRRASPARATVDVFAIECVNAGVTPAGASLGIHARSTSAPSKIVGRLTW
jgi:hypothetical protein